MLYGTEGFKEASIGVFRKAIYFSLRAVWNFFKDQAYDRPRGHNTPRSVNCISLTCYSPSFHISNFFNTLLDFIKEKLVLTMERYPLQNSIEKLPF